MLKPDERSQVKLAGLKFVFVNTHSTWCSVLGWLSWMKLGQISATFTICSSALLLKKAAWCNVFILFSCFSECWKILQGRPAHHPWQRNCFPVITHTLLRELQAGVQHCANIAVMSIRLGMQSPASELLEEEMSIWIFLLKLLLKFVCPGGFTCCLVSNKGKGSVGLKFHMDSAQVQSPALTEGMIYSFFSLLIYSIPSKKHWC